MTSTSHFTSPTGVADMKVPYGPRNIFVALTIKDAVRSDPARMSALTKLLHGDVFTVSAPGVHYARFTILKNQRTNVDPVVGDQLLLSGVFDGQLATLVSLITANDTRVFAIFEFVEGWESPGQLDHDPLTLHVLRFLQRHEIPTMLHYKAYLAHERLVNQSLTIRDTFIDFWRESQAVEDDDVMMIRWQNFLEASKKPIDRAGERHPDLGGSGSPSSDPMLINPYTMINQVWNVDWVRFVLISGEAQMRLTGFNPLTALDTLHFARMSVIPGTNRSIFCSVYDGSVPQYAADFANRIGHFIDLLFINTLGYPLKGPLWPIVPACVSDIPQMLNFMQTDDSPTQVFYGGYMGHTCKEVLDALDFKAAIDKFAETLGTDDPGSICDMIEGLRGHPLGEIEAGKVAMRNLVQASDDPECEVPAFEEFKRNERSRGPVSVVKQLRGFVADNQKLLG